MTDGEVADIQNQIQQGGIVDGKRKFLFDTEIGLRFSVVLHNRVSLEEIHGELHYKPLATTPNVASGLQIHAIHTWSCLGGLTAHCVSAQLLLRKNCRTIVWRVQKSSIRSRLTRTMA